MAEDAALPERLAGNVKQLREARGFTQQQCAKMAGVPHTPGTREYLTCETGELLLVVSGEKFVVGVGDVAVFRGDQKHSYANNGARVAVGYSVVVLAKAV